MTINVWSVASTETNQFKENYQMRRKKDGSSAYQRLLLKMLVCGTFPPIQGAEIALATLLVKWQGL
jgi:hypothetical protein